MCRQATRNRDSRDESFRTATAFSEKGRRGVDEGAGITAATRCGDDRPQGPAVQAYQVGNAAAFRQRIAPQLVGAREQRLAAALHVGRKRLLVTRVGRLGCGCVAFMNMRRLAGTRHHHQCVIVPLAVMRNDVSARDCADAGRCEAIGKNAG